MSTGQTPEDELREALAEALRERDILRQQLRGVNKAFEAAQTVGHENTRRTIDELVEKNAALADELRLTREQLINTAGTARRLIRAQQLLREAATQMSGGGMVSPTEWGALAAVIQRFLSGEE